jgi:hypothetical protein
VQKRGRDLLKFYQEKNSDTKSMEQSLMELREKLAEAEALDLPGTKLAAHREVISRLRAKIHR